MTALAIGSVAILTVGDGGYVSVASNGGFATYQSVTMGGITTSLNMGPLPERKVHGPFKEGATVTITNVSCASMDVDSTANVRAITINGSASLVDGAGNAVAGGMSARAKVLAKLQDAARGAAIFNPDTGPLTTDAPTIVVSQTGTGGFIKKNLSDYLDLFDTTGGDASFSASGQYLNLYTMNVAGGAGNGNLNGLGGIYTANPYWDMRAGWLHIHTAANIVEFQVKKDARPYFIKVDGAFVDHTGVDASGGASSVPYIRLTFGARRPRDISVYIYNPTMGVYNVGINAIDDFSRPQRFDPSRSASFGDSFGVAQNSNISLAFPYQFANAVGIQDMRNYQVGGTGYVIGTPTMLQQIANCPRVDVDLVQFTAGYNDSNQATLGTAAITAWTAMRARAPNALFAIWGPQIGKRGPSAQNLTDEALLEAAFNTWADPFSIFMRVSNLTSPYQSGTGQVGTTTGVGNSDLTTSADGTHPSDYGHQVIGLREAEAYRAKLFAFSVT